MSQDSETGLMCDRIAWTSRRKKEAMIHDQGKFVTAAITLSAGLTVVATAVVIAALYLNNRTSATAAPLKIVSVGSIAPDFMLPTGCPHDAPR